MAAGAIMSVVGCIFLLMTIGTDWENRVGGRELPDASLMLHAQVLARFARARGACGTRRATVPCFHNPDSCTPDRIPPAPPPPCADGPKGRGGELPIAQHIPGNAAATQGPVTYTGTTA